jgi:hypothetical protein
MTHHYQLIPFSTLPIAYSVGVTVERCHNKLKLSFELIDPQSEAFWPLANEMTRQDFLWESTCFEAFIGSHDRREYFELNLTPSLAWNLYRFSDYRTPNVMPPVAVVEPALTQFGINQDIISAEIDLNVLNIADQDIRLGLTAVIKTAKASHYFALQHSSPQADFHDPRDWIIRL